jgi:hypothetical protein
MRLAVFVGAGVLAVGMAASASGQSWDAFQHDPRVEQPVPICIIDPRFCEPGDPYFARWRPNFQMKSFEDAMQSAMGGFDSNAIIVVDPRRVFVGADQVYIVPEGGYPPFEDRW